MIMQVAFSLFVSIFVGQVSARIGQNDVYAKGRNIMKHSYLFLYALCALFLTSCSGGSATDTNKPWTTATVHSIELSPSTYTLNPAASQQITATLKDASGATLNERTITWTTSNDACAVVSTSGLVTAIASGTATITAACEGKSATAAIIVNATQQPSLHLAIAVHSEDRYNSLTPDYQTDKSAYADSRAALLVFARAMASRQLKWNWQSDYNFLEACLKWEVQSPDAAMLALTGGKNVVRYLHEDLGVECDPHSHENDGYNFADIAYLLQALGVAPSPVVGGHVYDTSDPAYQNWPRFNGGISGKRFPSYFWKPDLLIGAATGNHANDPTASGMWRPQSPGDFFSTKGSGIAAFGGWDGKITGLSGLAKLVTSKQLAADRIWTFTLVLAQQYFVQSGYLETQVLPALDQILSMRNSGSVKVVQFTEALALWKTQYKEAEAVYRAGDSSIPASFFTFTLNTQDFSYPDESAALVTKVLDLHEATSVPIDISFTTSHAVLFAKQYPALWERLKGSSMVALSTHMRAPKPYAEHFDWVGMRSMSQTAQQAIVRSYETLGFDSATGQLTSDPGGYSRVKALAGYAPLSMGAKVDAPVAQAVYSVLADLGVRFVVSHGSAANLGDMIQGLALKPEHVDLQLFRSVGLDPVPILETALREAAAVPGAKAPYFVGVKMHDNDFFAKNSAWVTVYNNNGVPDLIPPWDLTKKAPLLSQTERDAMWTLYDKSVRYAASIRDRAGLLNLRDIAGMLP